MPALTPGDPVRSCFALLSLALAGPAVAQDAFPIDVELVRPGLSPMGGFSVDAPQAGAPRTWSLGALAQYESAPLRLFDGVDLVGPLVAHRAALALHTTFSVSRRTSFSLVLPMSVHFGAGDVERARNGLGLGDASVTARAQIGTWGRFTLGALGTVLLPTGNKAQYMGERLPRLRAGLLGYTDLGRVAVLTDLYAHLRETVETGYDFKAGSELHVDVGVQARALPGQLDVIGELVNRLSLVPGDQGGRLASEFIVGVRYTPRPGLRVDLAVGKGLTGGYGTTGIRGVVGLSYVHPPRPPPEPVVAEVDEEEPLPEVDDPPEAPPEAPPEPPPPPPAAQLAGEEIIFRDPIEFELGTTRLLPSSSPVLDAVAEVILSHPEIGQVVVEGHASQEGSFAYNYALSSDRARVIFEELVLRGVHPKRLSYRGEGEVEVLAGQDIEHNRRVVFQVVRQYLPGEARPALGDSVLLPWSGEPHAVGGASVPVVPAEPSAPPAEPAAPPVEEPTP